MTVRGKFLWAGDEKLYLKGVTYGTFRADDDGVDLPPPDRAEHDLAAMARAGFNVVRVYTVPPRQFLDAAGRHGLRVLVGLPWEQHVAFLDDDERCADVERRVRAGARRLAGHPSLLAFAVGNEIPASIVRWHGRRRVERWLERLSRAVREEAPGSLVTYVNFPSTEYLEPRGLDFVCFNVYLESREALAAYLKRLQNLAGDRPLVLAEIGLDSRRNGLDGQARSLAWQLRETFRAGAAGAFVFAWTDEWHRGGHDVDDWDFGLVDRERRPKPALEVVSRNLAHVPAGPDVDWPRISVVVCTHDGAATITSCLAAISRIDYPDYEVIVVDDGSTDTTATLIEEFDVRVVTTPGIGLSAARNLGMEASTGEIVAYTDDDAYPDPQWLTYLAIAFASSDCAAIGGPNLSPPGDGVVADCVANAPGGPIHVLLSDDIAEHIPGCNMAFRRDALTGIGGFDAQFVTAGDDVDVCWRLQDAGLTIGFHPAALVWHHRRGSVRAFWRQQRGYGRAEAMLEAKWPERYNAAGHVNWAGRIYGPGGIGLFRRWRVYHGTWGTGAFQSKTEAPTPPMAALPLMPEWYLIVLLLAGLTALGTLWQPLYAAGPLLVAAIVAVVAQGVRGALGARFSMPTRTRAQRLRLRSITAMLYILQGAARLRGRIAHGLAPWGRRARLALHAPTPRRKVVWSESWRAPEEWLLEVEARVRAAGGRVTRGSAFDRWDLQVRGGGLGGARLRLAVEEHGAGRQQLLFHVAPCYARLGLLSAAGLLALAGLALYDGAGIAAAVLAAASGLLLVTALGEASGACASALRATEPPASDTRAPEPAAEAADPLSSDPDRPRPPMRRRLALLRYVWPHKAEFVMVLGTLAMSTLLSIAQPWPMKILVDNVLGDHAPTGALKTAAEAMPGDDLTNALLVLVVGATVVIFLLNTFGEMLSSVAITRLGQRVTYGLAADVFAHLQKLSVVFHARRPVGDTIARVNGDTFGVYGLMSGVLLPVIHSIGTLVAMFVIMWQLSPHLTLLALAVVPLQVIAIVFFGPAMNRRSRRRLDLEGRLTSVVEQTLVAMPAVQAFTREPIENARYRHYADKTVTAYVRETITSVWFKLFAGIVTVSGTAGIMYLGAQEALHGGVTTGTIIVFLAYLAGLYGPLDSIVHTAGGYQVAAAQADRVLEILDTPLDVHDRPTARDHRITAGRVQLCDVTYGYTPGHPVLRGVSLEAEPGQVVAIVGPTGAGKTTLVNLLVRFFDPLQGTVAIDGRDLRDYTLRSLRGQIAMVLQDPFILPKSVADNIAYGRPDATREDVEAAAKAANAHEFILRLERGYDTVIGERGATLSGGEKQRLSIARAFLKDAPILVLDEPTSALDARTEAALLDALRNLAHGRTSFIIAHRLSTIRDADTIVVVDQGKVVEQGRHDDLVAGDGLYRTLYESQTNIVRHASAAKRFQRAVRPEGKLVGSDLGDGE